MTVPAFTVYTGETPDFKAHPRLLFRHVDKAALTARTNSTAGWKNEWDMITPREAWRVGCVVDEYMGNPIDIISQDGTGSGSINNAYSKTLAMAFWGWIEETGRTANGATDTAIDAVIWAVDNVTGLDKTESRIREMLQVAAVVYDICYDQMTVSERQKVAGFIVGLANWIIPKLSPLDNIDGHSGINATCTLLGLLAAYNNPSYASTIADQLDDVLQYLFGTTDLIGRLSYPRLCFTDGHTEKGHHYIYYGFWCELIAIWAMTKATSWNGFVAESAWTSKVWEELLWHCKGGSVIATQGMGDMYRYDPPFGWDMRWGTTILAAMNSASENGRMEKWLFDQWEATNPHVWGATRVFDVIFLDRANIAALHPKDASPSPSTSRLFTKPGVYYGRKAKRGSSYSSWDIDNIATIRISARGRYYSGHAHLDAGSMNLSVKGDIVCLTPAGVYDGAGTTLSHYNGYTRSWLQSWVPLIYNSSEEFRWQNGSTVSINDGGQQWKLYAAYTPIESTRYDSGSAWHMYNDAGGEAWMRCREFSKVEETVDSHTFLFANIADAYKLYNTSSLKCPILEVKYLVIWPNASNGLYWPAVLYYARIKKQTASWPVKIPVHTATSWTATSYGAHTVGYQGVGKLWIDIFNKSAQTVTIRPYSSSTRYIAPWNSAPYQPQDAKGSELPFETKSMLTIGKTAPSEEEHYVVLSMLSEADDPEPAQSRQWITDANWYGITLGSVDYRISKTLKTCSVGGGGPDTTPPGEVSSFLATAKNRGILVTWTDPADADLKDVMIKCRTSATS